MIPFRIKLSRFKSKQINLPSSWSEVSLDQFFRIQELEENSDPSKLFEILTGESLKIDFTAFIPFMEWIAEPLKIEDFDRVSSGVNIMECSYRQKVMFSMELSKKKLLESAPKLLSIYLPQSESYFRRIPISKSLPLLIDLLEQFKLQTEKENAISIKPTPIEIQAGSERLNQLSHFNTIDQIAREYSYTHDEVENLSANTVFLIMCRKSFLRTFETNLRELRKQNDNSAVNKVRR